jgi:type IV pilus assembly protein PilB
MAPEGLLPERLRVELARVRPLSDLLAFVLSEARRLTDAEAGAVYLRHGDDLRMVVAQNELLACRRGAAAVGPELMDRERDTVPAIPAHVTATGETVNVRDVYRVPEESPFRFDRGRDLRLRYRTRSLMAVPLTAASGEILGVVELVNARDANREIGPFATWHELVVEALATNAAAAIDRAPADADVADVVPAGELVGPVVRARPAGRRLGELVMAHGLVTAPQLEGALAEQRHTKENVGLILVRRGVITEQQLTFFLSQQFKVPAVALEGVTADPVALALVPYEIAAKHELVPLQRVGESLMIAIADPNNLAAIEDLGFLTGLEIFPSIAPRSTVRQTIERFYMAADASALSAEPELDEIEIVEGDDVEGPVDLLELRTSADETPVVRLVNGLIRDAIRRRASDIHLEPFESTLRVRFRVDGVLRHVTTRPRRLEAPLVSRIKIMANLDISERRRPQDGHLRIRYEGREVDLRVGILPTRFGEAVAIRILDRANLRADLPGLGFDGASLQTFREAVAAPHGLVLITGPTGSGKTTTLYGALKSLNAMETKILTIEDPVEYGLEGVNQVEVNEGLGRTFASTLRSFLRHDPDVVMVGEMRDLDTAQVAIRAGLTGHLVLSTLHTNDAPSSVTRLIDMGIPPFLVAGALRLVVAQRLVRRLCTACREPYEIEESSLAIYGHLSLEGGRRTVYRAKGCAQCDGRGLKGRVGLYQVMPFSDELRELTLVSPSPGDLDKVARQEGMPTLRELGFAKVFEGVTTVDEVLRVTAE